MPIFIYLVNIRFMNELRYSASRSIQAYSGAKLSLFLIQKK